MASFVLKLDSTLHWSPLFCFDVKEVVEPRQGFLSVCLKIVVRDHRGRLIGFRQSAWVTIGDLTPTADVAIAAWFLSV